MLSTVDDNRYSIFITLTLSNCKEIACSCQLYAFYLQTDWRLILCYWRFIVVLQPDNTAKCEIDTLVNCVCFTFWTDEVWSGLGRVWTNQSCWFFNTSWLQVIADLVSGFTTTVKTVMRFTARGSNNSCFSLVGW